MTTTFIKFNTSEGEQIAIGDNQVGDTMTTVVVLSETDADGLTSGEFSIKHNVPFGTDPGTWTHQ